MKKVFEYKVISGRKSTLLDRDVSDLNEHGSKGWEIVLIDKYVTMAGEEMTIILFKREL